MFKKLLFPVSKCEITKGGAKKKIHELKQDFENSTLIEFPFFFVFKPLFPLLNRNCPEDIMVLEENFNNVNNLFILKDHFDAFYNFLNYTKGNSVIIGCQHYVNYFMVFFSRFFNFNLYCNSNFGKAFNLFYNFNPKAELILKMPFHVISGLNSNRCLSKRSILQIMKHVPFQYNNCIFCRYFTFFCQKNSWCNPFHKNKKVCVKFADFFKKKKFFYKKLKSKENNLEKTNYNDEINTTFNTKKLLLS